MRAHFPILSQSVADPSAWQTVDHRAGLAGAWRWSAPRAVIQGVGTCLHRVWLWITARPVAEDEPSVGQVPDATGIPGSGLTGRVVQFGPFYLTLGD